MAIVGLLLAVERRKRLKPGQLFALYVALYTAGRWAIETLRIDEATEVAGFRVNELVAPAVGVLAVLAFVLLGRRDDPAMTAPELEAEATARAERAAAERAASADAEAEADAEATTPEDLPLDPPPAEIDDPTPVTEDDPHR